MDRPIRLAAVAGWHGDRKEAMLAQAEADPPADVLVGDWLAELTIGWAARERYVDLQRDPEHGRDDYYMKTVVDLFDRAVDTIVIRKQKLITNAGGLSPKGCAEALEKVLQKHGHELKIAYVTGDDFLDRFEELNQQTSLKHFDNGKELSALHKGTWIGANAYIGAWGVVEALRQGADIVVTGRTTDASAIVAAAAWWHDWSHDQYDHLAQAVVRPQRSRASPGNYKETTLMACSCAVISWSVPCTLQEATSPGIKHSSRSLTTPHFRSLKSTLMDPSSLRSHLT